MNKNIILFLCALLLISFVIAQPISKRNANEIELSTDEDAPANDVADAAEASNDEGEADDQKALDDVADSNDEADDEE